jgi:alpha-L-rhamnosidase
MTNPIGTDDDISFSWHLESDNQGVFQVAYRIIAYTENITLWDSGLVESNAQTSIDYKGRKLKSCQRVFWSVTVIDNFKNEAVSECAFFETALLNQSDWNAKWIINADVHDLYGNIEQDKPLPSYIFRKDFIIGKKVKNARIYVCGLGFFTIKVNGEKLSKEVLAPGYTRYDKRTLYCTYDITEFLTDKNTIAIALGNGRYNGFAEGVWDLRCEPWRSVPKLIAQLHVDYEDGTTEIIVTDKSWKTDKGPAYFNCLNGGEHYDARLEQNGWDIFGFDSSSWTYAEISRGTGGILFPSNYPPIRINSSIESVKTTKIGNDKIIYDFGQNISGWIKIKVIGKTGAQIIIKTAEFLEDGDICTRNIDNQYVKRDLFQVDKYTLRGETVEEWEPSFTYHGFRYAQITGDLAGMEIIDICARCVHTDIDKFGNFECSNEMLNKIHHLCIWATKTNFHSIPTDCPSREKRGWTGDAVMSAEQSLFNFDMNAFYTKWLRDFVDCQRANGQIPGVIPTGYWGYNWGNGPAWDAALIMIPWNMYAYTGNEKILRMMYPIMLKYMKFLESMADNYILGFGLGDWNSPEFGNGYKYPIELSDTAFYFSFSVTLTKIAKVLNKKKDMVKFNRLANNIKSAARKAFVGKDGAVKGECQTAYALALCLGICDENDEALIADRLEKDILNKNYAFDFGHFGCKFVFEALSKAGKYETAYKLATSNMYPSFGWMIEQGATTLWEGWSKNASMNHHYFSGIDEWIYKTIAGINLDEKQIGYKKIIINPIFFDGLNFVKAEHQTPYGILKVSYEREKSEIKYEIEVPVSSTAQVIIPSGYIITYGETKLDSGKYRLILKRSL